MPARNRLSPAERLKSRAEIDRLFAEGNKCSGGSFSLLWRAEDSFRFAVLVSRRHGGAVRRNRIKRIYREAVRLNKCLLSRPVHVAILPAARVKEPSFSEVHEGISRIFKRLSDRPA